MYCVGSVSPELHNNTHFLLGTLQTDFSNALSLVQYVCQEINDFVTMQYAGPDIEYRSIGTYVLHNSNRKFFLVGYIKNNFSSKLN